MLPLFLRLFTQVHILIDGSVEGQYITMTHNLVLSLNLVKWLLVWLAVKVIVKKNNLSQNTATCIHHTYYRIVCLWINFFFNLLRTFCPHLGRVFFLCVVTVSPAITAFHSCCLSHHVFDQVNLWPAWVGFETVIFWQCSPCTVETQRLYPLRHGPRSGCKEGFFGLINPYLVFHSRVRTESL